MRECDAGRHTNTHAHAHVYSLARGGVARKGLPRWPATLDGGGGGGGGSFCARRSPPSGTWRSRSREKAAAAV